MVTAYVNAAAACIHRANAVGSDHAAAPPQSASSLPPEVPPQSASSLLPAGKELCKARSPLGLRKSAFINELQPNGEIVSPCAMGFLKRRRGAWGVASAERKQHYFALSNAERGEASLIRRLRDRVQRAAATADDNGSLQLVELQPVPLQFGRALINILPFSVLVAWKILLCSASARLLRLRLVWRAIVR